MADMDLNLDCFKFYDIENIRAQGEVLLKGQFDKRPQKMQIALLDFFGNPVQIGREPLHDKNAHLSWYRGIQPSEPMRRVILENRFGKFDIRTGTGYGLLVPTHKVERGSAFPEALDHYKVYRLVDVEQIPDITLTLRDQFGAGKAKLRLPQYFAVPVRKRVKEKDYPIRNDRAHLLIFSITTQDFRKKVTLRNQFARSITVNIVRSLMLAVPCIKHEWKQM